MPNTEELIRKSVVAAERTLQRNLADNEGEIWDAHTQQRAAIILLLNKILEQESEQTELIRKIWMQI